MRIYIYKITNSITNKLYIGSTNDFDRRKKEHLKKLRKNKHANSHLQNSFNKHSEKSFCFEIIEKSYQDKRTEREQYWIDQYDFENELYNQCPKAQSCFGRKVSKETREKIRQAKLGKGYPRSKETKEKIRIANTGENHWNYGGTLTKEHKQKLSKSLSGSGNPMYGKPCTKERADKIANSQPSRKRVAQIDVETGNVIQIFRSIHKASKETGVTRAGISGVANKASRTKGKYTYKLQTAGGYKWKFV